jgi:hypothetical protein
MRAIRPAAGRVGFRKAPRGGAVIDAEELAAVMPSF